MEANRKYKDSMFRDIFCNDLHGKENFLALYNSLHGTDLRIETTKIEPVNIDQTMYMGIWNDVAMQINERIVVMIEHQSTINENMPFRCLMYVSKIYEKLTEKRDFFSSRLINIPKPEFYVFYNGKIKIPQLSFLKLSDAFIPAEKSRSSLELVVPVYNISRKNKILENCRPLTDYIKFVQIAEQKRLSGETNWMDQAIKECQKQNVMIEYLQRKTPEVCNMYWQDFDLEFAKQVWKEDAQQEGYENGFSVGQKKGFDAGQKLGFDTGFNDGFNDGQNKQKELDLAYLKEKDAENEALKKRVAELEALLNR